MASNVVNLRPLAVKPYDHAAEDGLEVRLPEIGWALVHEYLRQSPLAAVRDCGDEIARQVRTHQSRRLQPAGRNR